MRFKILHLIAVLACAFSISSCANRGNPSGGEKDTTPPVITKSEPENFNTNFTATEIEISFDEYIKVKDLQKNLIVSPPMDPAPVITPLGSASKRINIKIYDTLAPNTTYAFNFGESIVDNNEENPYPFYRYVFSTGSYIDSLSISGQITDALEKIPDTYVSVMLYEVDSTFTDSVIYKEKPKYITNTLDSISAFNLENLRAGRYLMVAIKDENSNYTYEQKLDKIGFVPSFINVPSDSSYTIRMFKEDLDFKVLRPKQISGQRIGFAYEGSAEEMKVQLLSKVTDSFNYRITKDRVSDTLNYWYRPNLDLDSLLFLVSGPKQSDTLNVRLRDLPKDTLEIRQVSQSVVTLEDAFELEFNVPLEALDTDLITLMDKDSVIVDFNTRLDSLANKLSFEFKKAEDSQYKMRLLPGAITDFFGDVNDTLNYNIRTRPLADYGNIRLILNNATYPVIVQLVDQGNNVRKELYSTKPEQLDFTHMDPGRYFVRVIFDSNGNGRYDPGNYLLKIQAERISYYPQELEVRASWNFIETFTLQD